MLHGFSPHPWAAGLTPLVVLSLAGVDALLLWRLGRSGYDWRETRISIAVALGHRLIVGLAAGLVALVFSTAWQLRVATVPLDTDWGIGLLLLATEFCSYWQHRVAHTSNWFWASHRVHHTATRLNLSAAVRLGWTATLSGAWLFYLPLPLLGFNPAAVAAALAFNLFYQLWLHTELAPPLGPLEAVLNTPARHRVHHAANRIYLDKNFGGVLLVFDRLFGTAMREQGAEPCRYGLSGEDTPQTMFAVVFGGWSALLRSMRSAQGWRARLAITFGRPGNPPRQTDSIEASPT